MSYPVLLCLLSLIQNRVPQERNDGEAVLGQGNSLMEEQSPFSRPKGPHPLP